MLIDGSGSMLERKKGEVYPWSLSAALIGANYLSQICHELKVDFEVAIFNRAFLANENENEDMYLKRIKEKKPRFTRKQLQSMLTFDTILNPKQAIELGLADKVYGDE